MRWRMEEEKLVMAVKASFSRGKKDHFVSPAFLGATSKNIWVWLKPSQELIPRKKSIFFRHLPPCQKHFSVEEFIVCGIGKAVPGQRREYIIESSEKPKQKC